MSRPSSTGGRKGTRWLLKLCRAYFIGFLIIGLAGWVIGERWWLTILLTYPPQVVFLIPGLLLLPFALISRSIPALRWLVAAGLLWALLEGARWPLVPRWASTNETTIKVLTYNIHSATGGVEKIAGAIRKENPEVICLQEAKPWLNLPNPVPALQQLLPEWTFTNSGDVAIGIRGGSIERQEIQPYPVPGSFRLALGVQTHLKGRPITIVTTHLATAMYAQTLTKNRRGIPTYLTQTGEVRRIQLQGLRQFLNEFPGPKIICGDFNTPPRGVEYARLTRDLDDAFAESGKGFGWSYPANRPLLRIDYIFTAGGSRAVEANTRAWPYSDHRPVVATVTLP
ncbi:MAG: endonuclease/exonuclease/phosphatase family protein [Armatimonas sp.]